MTVSTLGYGLRAETHGGSWSALEGAWGELVAADPDATPFQSFAWAAEWWRAFGRLREPRVLALMEGQDLVALFPLMRSRAPWRAIRWIGTGHSDYLGPVVRPGWHAAAGAAFREWLAAQDDVDLADLHQVRQSTDLGLDGTPLGQSQCLVLDLPGQYDAYLAGLSKSLRFDCRKLGKEPFLSGRATIGLVAPDDVPATMGALFDLHARRWKPRGLPGAFGPAAVRRFHVQVAVRMARAGALRLGRLEQDGVTVGVIYVMAQGDGRYFYQCGFDPTVKALGPGTLLVAHAIQSAIGEGARCFDFMRGDEAYKRRWKPQFSRQNERWVVPLNHHLGNLGRALNHAGGRLESRVRARLERRGLLG